MRDAIVLILLALLFVAVSYFGNFRMLTMRRLFEWLAIASFAVLAVSGIVGLFLWISTR